MLNPFKIFNRLAWLAMLLFGGGTAAIVTVVVLATDGLGSGDLISLPTQPANTTAAPITPAPDVTLNEVVQKRPLLENVPLPSELSTEPSVVATNFGLAVLLAIVFGIISTTLNDLLRDEEETIRGWFRIPILRELTGLFKWAVGQNVQRGCLTLPIIVMIFALYGIIFAFLEDGMNIFTPEGTQLAIVMAMSVGLISLSGDVAQRQVARFWRNTARFGIYPANLLIAVVTTVFSRIFNLSPGIAFGTPGGADIEMDQQTRFREVVLAFTTLIVMVVLGGLGWAAAAGIRAAGDRTMSISQAEFAGPLAQLGLTIGLALFFVAVETSFFEMVPMGSTMGGKIIRWNPIIWGLAFIPVMFIFAHSLLNPDNDYLQAFEQTNVQVLTIMIAILAVITAVLWFYFKVLHRDSEPAPRPAYPQQQSPQAPRQQRPPQPQVPPPPVYGPPPARESRPAQNTYVPPPIIISDNVPPPIVISDEPKKPDPPKDDDETQSGQERRRRPPA